MTSLGIFILGVMVGSAISGVITFGVSLTSLRYFQEASDAHAKAQEALVYATAYHERATILYDYIKENSNV
jgi:hypothetical protein